MDTHLLAWLSGAIVYVVGGIGSCVGTFLLTEDTLGELTLAQRRVFLGGALALWPLHVIMFGWLSVQTMARAFWRARRSRTTR